MTVLEQKRYQLIRAIMDDTDGTSVSMVERIYFDNPLLYSVEELNESLCNIGWEFENRNMKCYTFDQIKKHAV